MDSFKEEVAQKIQGYTINNINQNKIKWFYLVVRFLLAYSTWRIYSLGAKSHLSKFKRMKYANKQYSNKFFMNLACIIIL